jgi:hypothetical protein
MAARSTVSSVKNVTVTLLILARGRVVLATARSEDQERRCHPSNHDGQPRPGRRPSPPCLPPALGLAHWPPGTAGPRPLSCLRIDSCWGCMRLPDTHFTSSTTTWAIGLLDDPRNDLGEVQDRRFRNLQVSPELLAVLQYMGSGLPQRRGSCWASAGGTAGPPTTSTSTMDCWRS